MANSLRWHDEPAAPKTKTSKRSSLVAGPSYDTEPATWDYDLAACLSNRGQRPAVATQRHTLDMYDWSPDEVGVRIYSRQPHWWTHQQ